MIPTCLMGLFLAACQGAIQDPPGEFDQEIELTAQMDLVRELAGGRSHIYRFGLQPEKVLSLTVDQKGIDIVCELINSDGDSILLVDGMSGAWGREEVFWQAREGGIFRLEVRAGKVDRLGSYHLETHRLDSASDENDTHRASAVKFFDAAERSRRETSSRSLIKAISQYQEALDIWRQIGDQAQQAETLYRLGLIQAQLKNKRKAIEYYQQAAVLFEAKDNRRMWSSTLHQLGRSLYQSGEIESAGERYEEALRLRMALGDLRTQAFTLNNLGLVKVILGEFQAALTHYDDALERWREINRPSGEAGTLHNRGRCYLYLGQFQQALDDLNQALEIRQETHNLAGQAVTLTGIGLVHEALTLFPDPRSKTQATNASYLEGLEKSLRFLHQALEIQVATGHRPGQMATLSIIGRINGWLEREAETLGAFDQALKISRELGDRHREAFVLYDAGVALVSLGQTEKALQHLHKALPLLEATGRQHAIDALSKIALAERQLGNLEAARMYVEKAIEKNEALRIQPASHALRSSLFAIRHDFYDFYVDLLMEFHRREPSAGFAAQALAASERARARSQLEALLESGADLRRGADPQWVARERALEIQINAKELQRLRLLDEAADIDQIGTVEKELRTLLRDFEKVRGQLRQSSPTYTALTEPVPLDAAAIQQQVPSDSHLLLQYKLGKERSHVWAVTRSSISSFELPRRARIDLLARRVYDLLVVSNRRESRLPLQRALVELGQILLEPVGHLLGGRKILVVSDSALQYIPFGALPLPTSTIASTPLPAKTLLMASEGITFMPSVATLAQLRRRSAKREQAPGWLAVVADPVFQTHDPRFRRDTLAAVSSPGLRGDPMDLRRFERLVFSEQEAGAILQLVPAEKSFQALGFAANRDLVMGGGLNRFQIIHFATHGYMDAEHPELSRLVLSLFDKANQPRNGFLFSHEIYGLELQAELVVLSACRTALGKEVRGEGFVGLTQAFMYAGATRVLVSLWPVNDQATAELMRHFYRHLLVDKQPAAVALKLAQLAILSEKRWQAPFYWAGFVLQGDG